MISDKLPKEQGYKLKEGDYVKLGRVRFKIKEINLRKDNFPNEAEPFHANGVYEDFIKVLSF